MASASTVTTLSTPPLQITDMPLKSLSNAVAVSAANEQNNAHTAQRPNQFRYVPWRASEFAGSEVMPRADVLGMHLEEREVCGIDRCLLLQLARDSPIKALILIHESARKRPHALTGRVLALDQ